MPADLPPVTPHVLGLGEPTHGDEALLAARNDIVRRIVERDGPRTFALESDCLMGLIVDDYVTGGPGELDAVMERGISHGWGAFPGNRALVRWMREYNDGRAAADQVRFAGVDGPLEVGHAASPRQALMALHARVEEPSVTVETLDALLGPDGRWTDPAVMYDPSRSVGRSPDADRLRVLTDDLIALLDMQGPVARLYGRTAVGLLRYHRWMADDSPHRLTRLLGQRAAMMTANLLALAAEGPVVVSAHNAHLQPGRSSMRMGGEPLYWWSTGSHLGDDYLFVPLS